MLFGLKEQWREHVALWDDVPRKLFLPLGCPCCIFGKFTYWIFCIIWPLNRKFRIGEIASRKNVWTRFREIFRGLAEKKGFKIFKKSLLNATNVAIILLIFNFGKIRALSLKFNLQSGITFGHSYVDCNCFRKFWYNLVGNIHYHLNSCFTFLCIFLRNLIE